MVQKDTNSLEYALQQYLGDNDNAMPPKFIRRFEQVVFNEDIGNDAICRRNLKNIAIVKFQLASPLITRIKKKQRVSFSDMVSSLGKLSHCGKSQIFEQKFNFDNKSSILITKLATQ